MGSSITVKQANDKYVISGAGGGDSSDSSSGATYTNQPDTLRSTDSFEILLGLGSGRWKGLVDGLRSLYINDVPLSNADGSTNFKDITAIFADGDPAQTQTVTFKLGGGGSITNVSTVIDNLNAPGTPGNWVVGATTTPNAQFVDLRFVVQQLYHSTPTGVFEATASLDIQMRPAGTSTWINPLTVAPVPVTYDPGDGSSGTGDDGSGSGTGTSYGPGDGTGEVPLQAYDTPPPTVDSGDGDYTIYISTGHVQENLAAPRPPSGPSIRGATIDPGDYVFTQTESDQDYASGSSTNTVTPLTTGYSGPLVITGKTMSPAVKELRISVPKSGVYADKTWEIRVRLVEPSHQYVNPGTETQEEYIRNIVFESITAVNKEILGNAAEWRGLAWMQIVGKASDQLNGFPSIHGIYDTKIVKVPPSTVFDPVTRNYTGTIWDGSYANAYTNDPAWCIKDLIEDTISGIAAISPGATLDKWDALEASKYCSAKVPDGHGGTHNRFCLNIRLEEAMNAEEMIQNIAGSFNGLCVDTGGGSWRLKIDKPETPVATYTLDNIIGEFQYSNTDIDTRFNDITVTFLNEDLAYLEDRIRVYDSDHIARYGRKSTTLIAVGCTNRQEALRRAVLRLRTCVNENKIVKFTTNRQGRLLEPLQTIYVADQHLGYAPHTGTDTDPFDDRTTSRITAMNGARTQLTLGRTVRLETGVAYTAQFTVPNPNYTPTPTTQPTNPDWKLPTIVITRTLTNTSGQRGDTNTLYLDSALPANTPANATVALSATGLPALPVQYRILEISPSDGEFVGVTALLIDSGKYAAADAAVGSNIDAWTGTGSGGGGGTGGGTGSSGGGNTGGGQGGQNGGDILMGIDTSQPRVPSTGMFVFTSFMNNGQQQRTLSVVWRRPYYSNYLQGYKVERRINDSLWTVITDLTSQTSMDFTDPVPGIHWFRITPVNLRGRTGTPLVGGYEVPAIGAGVGIPHSYGIYLDRPTAGMVVGQLYTAIDIPMTPTYRWNGTAWTTVSTNGSDINGDGGSTGGWTGGIYDGGSGTPGRRLPRAEVLTLLGTSASIVGQGALATRNNVAWGTEVTGRPLNLASLTGSEVLDNAAVLAQIADDNILSAPNKSALLRQHQVLEAGYTQISTRAAELNLVTTPLNTARSNYLALLDSYDEPNWFDYEYVANFYSKEYWSAAAQVSSGTATLVNSFLYSEQLDNTAGWTPAAASVTANAAISPIDGTMSADKLVEDNTSAHHQLSPIAGALMEGGDGFTGYAKAAERSYLRIDRNNGDASRIVFDLSNGTIANSTGDPGTWTGEFITPVAGYPGWYRFGATLAAGLAAATVRFKIMNANVVSGTYTGTTGSGIYLTGLQWTRGVAASSTQGYVKSVANVAIQNGIGGLPSVNYTRNGVLLAQDSDGSILTFQDNQPVIVNQGIILNPSLTNLLLNAGGSTDLVTQSVTTTATGYTLAIIGTGSVTLSGTATGTLAGTGLNSQAVLNFTPTAGTLTLTVSGSVKYAVLYAGTYATPVPIVPTAGATATTGQSSLVTNIVPDGSAIPAASDWMAEVVFDSDGLAVARPIFGMGNVATSPSSGYMTIRRDSNGQIGLYGTGDTLLVSSGTALVAGRVAVIIRRLSSHYKMTVRQLTNEYNVGPTTVNDGATNGFTHIRYLFPSTTAQPAMPIRYSAVKLGTFSDADASARALELYNGTYAPTRQLAWDNLNGDTKIFINAFPDELFPDNWTTDNVYVNTRDAPIIQLHDNSQTVAGRIYRDITQVGENKYSVGLAILKGGSAFNPSLQLKTLGGAAQKNTQVQFDLNTGAWASTGDAFDDVNVFDIGTSWYIEAVITTYIDSTGLRVELYPSWSQSNAHTSDVTLQGTIKVTNPPQAAKGNWTKLGQYMLAARLANYSSLINSTIRAISQSDWGADINGVSLFDSGSGTPTTPLTRAEVRTSLGTAAAITGQGALATASSASWTTQITGRPTELTDGRITTALNSSGILQTNITSTLADSSNILRRTAGGLFTGELAADVTSTHTAAAITGQGALATLSSAAWATQVSGRPTELTDGRITTALNSSGILQTNITSTLADSSNILRRTAGGLFTGELAADVTSTHTAAAITGQGALATLSSVSLDSQVTDGTYYGRTLLADRSSGGSNLLLNPTYVNSAQGWNIRTGTLQAADANFGQQYVRTTLDTEYVDHTSYYTTTDRIPVAAGETVFVSGHARGLTATQKITVEIAWFKADGTTITPSTFQTGNLSISSGGTDFATSFVAPNNTASMGFRYQWNKQTTGTGVDVGQLYVGRVERAATEGGTFGVNLTETAGGTIATLANFKTISGTAAGITGQGTFATINSISLEDGVKLTNTTRISKLDPSTGRMTDVSGFQSNRSYGLRATNVPPTFSDTWIDSTHVTINIGASTLTSDAGDVLSLPSGTITGNLAGTKYYIWRNMTDPQSATGSYGASTNLDNALATTKVYLGFWTTRSTSGGTGGGGGFGGSDCVALDAFVLTENGPVRAIDVYAGMWIWVLDEKTMEGRVLHQVESNHVGENDRVTLVMASGAEITMSINTPLTLRDKSLIIAAHGRNHEIPIEDENGFRWEKIIDVRNAGHGYVSHIKCGNKTYGAGDYLGQYIYAHNAKP